MADVVVIVPGTMGSVLTLNGKVIWPGPIRDLATNFNRMAELKDPAIQAVDLIRSYLVPFGAGEQYGALIEDLESLRYHEKGQPKTLWVCPYDWRTSNLLAADTLAAVIDRAAAANPGKKIALIAHSMGGLISRCYLESGQYNTRAGFTSVTDLFTLGTPHRGAPEALFAIKGWSRKLFLAASQVVELANDPRFPSVYELLPPPNEPFAQDADMKPVDIYDPAIAARLGLNAANLAAARKFHATLDLARKPAHVRYFYFAGTRDETITSAWLRDDVGGALKEDREFREGGGDGTVPIWSAIETGRQNSLVGTAHGTIYKDRKLRRNLGILLGRPGVLEAPLETQLDLSAAEEVVPPETSMAVGLNFSRPLPKIDATLRFVEVNAQGEPVPGGFVSAPASVTYSGASLDRMTVQLQSPPLNGFYKLEADAGGLMQASQLIIVQD